MSSGEVAVAVTGQWGSGGAIDWSLMTIRSHLTALVTLTHHWSQVMTHPCMTRPLTLITHHSSLCYVPVCVCDPSTHPHHSPLVTLLCACATRPTLARVPPVPPWPVC